MALQDGLGALSSSTIVIILLSIICLLSLIVTIFYCTTCCRNYGVPFKSFGIDDFHLDGEDADRGDIQIRPPVQCTSISEGRGSFIGPCSGDRVTIEPLPELTEVLSGSHSGGGGGAPGGPVEYQPHPLRPRMHRDKELLSAIKPKPVELMPANKLSVKRAQLFFVSELAEGWFGPVLHGEATRADGRKSQVVIRMLAEDRNDKWQRAQFLAEAQPYKDVTHEALLKLVGICSETTPYLIIQEHLDSGDLKAFLVFSRSTLASLDQRNLLLRWCAQFAAGLHALHSKGFIHHDLSTRSCLLSHDLNLKIGDYGFTEIKYKEDYMPMYMDNSCGNLVPVPVRWSAPDSFVLGDDDQLRLGSVTEAANLWSAGVVLWEIGSLAELPYADLSDREVLIKVVRNRERRPGPPRADFKHAKHIQQLTEQCWAEVNCRLSAADLSSFLEQLFAAHVSEEDFERRWTQYMEDARVSSLQVQQVQKVEQEQFAERGSIPNFSPPLVDEFDLNFGLSLTEEELESSAPLPQIQVQLQQQLSAASSVDSFAALQAGPLFCAPSGSSAVRPATLQTAPPGGMMDMDMDTCSPVSSDSAQGSVNLLEESVGLLPGTFVSEAPIEATNEQPPVPTPRTTVSTSINQPATLQVSDLRHGAQFRGSTDALLIDEDEEVDNPVIAAVVDDVNRTRAASTILLDDHLSTSFTDLSTSMKAPTSVHLSSLVSENLCQYIVPSGDDHVISDVSSCADEEQSAVKNESSHPAFDQMLS